MTTNENLAELLRALDLTEKWREELHIAEREASAYPENKQAAQKVKELQDILKNCLEVVEEIRGVVTRHPRNGTD